MKEYIAANGFGHIQTASLFHIRYQAGHTAHLPRGTSADTLIIMLSGSVRCQIPGQRELLLTPDSVTVFPRYRERTSVYLTDTHLLSVHLQMKTNVFDESAIQLPLTDMNAHSRSCLAQLVESFTQNRPMGDLALASCLYGLLDACVKNAQTEVPQRYRAVHAAMQEIDANFTSERPISEYAKDAAMSVSAFRRLFAEYTGKPPVKYRQEKRLEYVRLLVGSGECNISEAAVRAGFNSLPYLCRLFRKHYGSSLGDYLRGDHSAEI